MDLNFEQLLSAHNEQQAFREAEVYDDWMPDDGDYIVSFVNFKTGSKARDGATFIWFRLTARIEDVQDIELNGKEFPLKYNNGVYGILKGAAQVLSGQIITDPLDAAKILEASVGQVARVRVRTSRSQKNNKDYTNCYILEVINTTTEASAEDISNATDPAPIETLDIVSPAGVPEPPLEAPAEAPIQ